MGNLFTELMRRLFALLDGIVAWAIELLYVLLIKIADTNVFGELIYQYLGRIYTFLGIFMVFKLSFAYKLKYVLDIAHKLIDFEDYYDLRQVFCLLLLFRRRNLLLCL